MARHIKAAFRSEGNLDDRVRNFNNALASSLDVVAPVQTKQIIIQRTVPWYTDEARDLKKCMRRRETIWRKYRRDDTWLAFKVARSKYRAELNRAKREILSDKVRECGNDTRKLYALVNALTGAPNNVNPLPDCNNYEQLAEEFASHFMNKINNIRDSFDVFPKYNPPFRHIPKLTQFNRVTVGEVEEMVNNMQAKACDSDPVPAKVFKEIAPLIVDEIAEIVNISLTEGDFATSWKVATIKLLLKKPSLEPLLKNYRPVSNLTFMSKLLERCMLKQFNRHTEQYQLMPSYQSAYRQNHSCETSLVKLTNDILWSMEEQCITAVLALDLSAAFDTVDHDILLQVLRNQYGIDGKALKWYDSYLRPRSCMVQVKGETSAQQPLEFSVPQGSCGGPVLYSAYASTLGLVVSPPLKINGFADDHSINISFKAKDHDLEENCIIRLENCAVAINDWMNQNRLKMNLDKTDFILFGSPKLLPSCSTDNINVCGDQVSRCDRIKLLGIWLDSNLNFKHQITIKCRTAILNIQKLKYIINVLNPDAARLIVHGMVMSHLDYSNALYFGLPENSIKKLQRVQNMAAKVILGKRRSDSSRDCLKALHWLPVWERIEYKILTLVFKCIVGEAPTYLIEMIQERDMHREGLQSNGDFKSLTVPQTRRQTFVARSFSVAGPTLWNSLPNTIKQSNTVEGFKVKLKTFLFRRAFY